LAYGVAEDRAQAILAPRTEMPMTLAEPGARDDSTAGDIETRGDIHDLVVAFYREIVFDDVLAPVFGEVVEVDWALHIPKLIDYWCRILLGQPGYAGAILAAHREVHEIEPLRVEHFDRWYALWVASIEQRWAGPIANKAKGHAAHIATVLARKVLDLDWRPAIPLVEPS
jgi:hemoglobin